MPKQINLIPDPTQLPDAERLDLPTLLGGDQTLLAPLQLAGIATVEALCALTGAEVRNRRGMGPKRVMLVHAALQAHGLDFAPEPTRTSTPRSTYEGIRGLTDRWCAAFAHVTGSPYVWTPGGQTSDNKASQAIYLAVGWTAEPSAEVVQATGDTVRRYLRDCVAANPPRVPTLYDLARNLARFRQADRLVDATRARTRVDVQVQRDNARVDLMANLLNRKPKGDIDA